MKLVIDANILFAALIKKGETSDLIFKHDIYAPEFIFEEFKKYIAELKNKTSRTEEEFDLFFELMESYIVVISKEETTAHLEYAAKISPDANDMAYFALALRLNCPIWSNDKKLKEQKEVRVYSTEELIRK